MSESWIITDETNCGQEENAGSIKLKGPKGLSHYHIFKIEPNGCYAFDRYSSGQTIKQESRKFAEEVVKVLNRELPGGRPRVRRKGKR